MPTNPETQFPQDYRSARKAFIAACAKARADAISRAHMDRPGPDGKPMFVDSVALGPRDARMALLVVANNANASAAMIALLLDGVTVPDGARLVLVHTLDPFAFMGVPGDPVWSHTVLKAIATEDLSRVTDLAVLASGLAEDELPAIFPPDRKIRLILRQIDAKSGSIEMRDAMKTELARL